jgi:hypothetical protein
LRKEAKVNNFIGALQAYKRLEIIKEAASVLTDPMAFFGRKR